jgi:hypothetical protein
MAEEAGRKADRTRSSYQEMTARGLMTFDELGAKLEELANTREVALQELEENWKQSGIVARAWRGWSKSGTISSGPTSARRQMSWKALKLKSVTGSTICCVSRCSRERTGA